MRRTRWIFLAAAWAAASFASEGRARADVIYNVTAPNAVNNVTSWAFGQVFTVGALDISVTSLGAYDAFGDGFLTPGGISVGIYRESDAMLLASTLVTSSDILSGGFRFASIAPLLLSAGEQYRVVAVSGDDAYNTSSLFTTSPLVSSDGYAYGASSVLAFLNTFTNAGTQDNVWMANFQATAANVSAAPEPSALALGAIGGLAAIFIARSRSRRPRPLA